MAFRRFAASPAGMGLSEAMARLNARHPWSHNDHFIGWILNELPDRRRSAVDVGCGRGELAAALSPQFETVRAMDADEQMVRCASSRCAGLDNVEVAHEGFDDLRGQYDLVTMICVLHHLEVAKALRRFRELVAPGGRLLVVGLAEPRSVADHAWAAASIVTNPIIGYVEHPWRAPEPQAADPVPVKDPALSFDELRTLAASTLPGSVMRRHLGFRHTLSWTRPS